MRYAGIIPNDLSAAPGVCVSFFVQGCPIHCPGCHNPGTWDFDGGKEFKGDTIEHLINCLTANSIHRDLCIMGGEPLCDENQFLTLLVCKTIKERLPDTKIYLWTGYTVPQLKDMHSKRIEDILEIIDCLIDGPYKESERDITLAMRGSKNQCIYHIEGLSLSDIS